MAGSVRWLALVACAACGCVPASANAAGQATNVIGAAAQPAAPAGDCQASLIGTWVWSGVNRTLERHGMAALEMETRMQLRADGRYVQRQRSRAVGEEWAEAEGEGAWSAEQASGSRDARQCILTMQGNQTPVLLSDRDSFSLEDLGITYRRAPD